MKTIKTLIATAAIAAATLSMTTTAMAGDMMIDKPWARASAGMAKAGGAFMSVVNMTGADDKMIAAKSDVAKKVELHTHLNEGGIMMMRQVPFIEVKAGATTMLKPGSYHVMFMGLHAPLKEGSTFPVTLVFEKAGEVTVSVKVMGVGAMGDAMNHGDMGKKMEHGKTMKHK